MQANSVERSPSLVCKSLLLTITMFLGAFGVFYSIWRPMHNAVPSFLLLEITSTLLLILYSNYMKGTLFPKYNGTRLKCVLVCACVIWVTTLAYGVFLLIMATRDNEEFTIRENGSYFAFVPCLIANVWGGLLIYETWRFIGMFNEQYGGSSVPYQFR